MHDYSETRDCLVRARDALAEAHVAMGRTNLPPASSPHSVRSQIDQVEQMLFAATQELEAARSACVQAGRRGLSVVGRAS